MSDNFLILIPAEPTFVPDRAAAERARIELERLVPDAEEVTVTVTEDVEFVDQGENFEQVVCPHCGSALAEEWWRRALDAASTNRFTDLQVTLPCCHRPESLNDLDYRWPAGFARFTLEATNPNVAELAASDVERLSDLLATPVRMIWAHY